MTPLQILERAREKLAQGWTRGCYARDNKDNNVDPLSPEACQFCAYGALHAAVGLGVYSALTPELRLAENTLKKILRQDEFLIDGLSRGLATFNDQMTQDDVLDLFDTAIAELKNGR